MILVIYIIKKKNSYTNSYYYISITESNAFGFYNENKETWASLWWL